MSEWNDLVHLLLAPIHPDRPAGEDLSYSLLFDQIREARRADDPALSQGDWAQSVKSAEWGKVRKLCQDALTTQSKDLQLLAWLTEALTRQDGLAGMACGLRLIDGWLERFWESGYPELDPHDLDERIGKIEWLNAQLTSALQHVPLTAQRHGSYDWLDWKASRDMDNLARLTDDESRRQYEERVAEGAVTGETFDKAAQHSGHGWFTALSGQVRDAQSAYQALDARLDERFGHHAPSLADLRGVLTQLDEVIQRIASQWQSSAPVASTAPAPVYDAPSAANTPATSAAATPVAATRFVVAGISNREDAIRQLGEVARYFRANEPHSPVALLVERAARWAGMSLEEWLATVVKDDSTLYQLNELLDVRRPD
ncbi:type VI secretion system protein TssA [Chitinibacteraceae bacterium HSL-7]